MPKEILKFRPECISCQYLTGDTPETAQCQKGKVPTCYRKKKPCTEQVLKNDEPAQKIQEAVPDTKDEPKAQIPEATELEPEKPKTVPDKAIAYTDGSYNKETKCWGYGVCLLAGDGRWEICGAGEDVYNGWQIQGEITGALAACEKAIELGAKELEIRYDYEGVCRWATGAWRTNKPYTADYVRQMREYQKHIKITFQHVKAHTGVEGNEYVDVLAKKACGIYVPPQATGFVPEIPSDVNPKCADAIRKFYKNANPKFGDYIKLKTFGMDPYSRKSYQELICFANDKGILDTISEQLGDGSREFCTAIRWAWRGLRAEDAIRKVQVDAEVSANCTRR